MMKIEEISAVNLALLGDAVFSLMVREDLVKQADYPVNEMTKRANKYVSAKAQANFMHQMLDQDFFSQEELDVYHRGRNANKKSKAKNADPITYHVSTGFEAVIGYLYLKQDVKRLKQIWDFINKEME